VGILQLYPQKVFYKSVAPQSFCQGQFCWIPVPHIDPVPRILDVTRSLPEHHDDVKFELRNANQQNDFKTNDRNLPIKRLNLRSNEELLVQVAKRRLGIIISSELDLYPEIVRLLRQKGKRHLQEDSLFLIPCYSIESVTISAGFPAEMVTRIRCLRYRQFFYFPTVKHIEDGVARFDRIQVVIGRDVAAIQPTDIALADDVFNLFLGMFIFCITGIEDGDIAAARSIVHETYPVPA
jgi:hypothetical protein